MRRRRIFGSRHHRGGHQRADGGLAHRHHVRVRTILGAVQEFQKADQVVGVILETERAGAQRHVAGIVPVRDVHIAVGQHRLHGGAQQGREMAGHRGHQQHFRLRLQHVLLEPQQGAERRGEHRHFAHRDAVIVHHHAVDAEGGALVGDHRGGKQIGRRGGQAHARVAGFGCIPAPDIQPCGGAPAEGRQKIGLGLIELVEHKPGQT